MINEFEYGYHCEQDGEDKEDTQRLIEEKKQQKEKEEAKKKEREEKKRQDNEVHKKL